MPQCPYPGGKLPSNVSDLGSHPWFRGEVDSQDLHGVPSLDYVAITIKEVGLRSVAFQLGDQQRLGFGGIDLHVL